jgi:hypothetical protein
MELLFYRGFLICRSAEYGYDVIPRLMGDHRPYGSVQQAKIGIGQYLRYNRGGPSLVALQLLSARNGVLRSNANR